MNDLFPSDFDLRAEMRKMLREELRRLLADPAELRAAMFARPAVLPFAGGTCTPGRLAKLDGSCNPSDSVLYDDGSGHLAIGTTTPNATFDIHTTTPGVMLSGSGTAFVLADGSWATQGRFGTETGASAGPFISSDVNGNRIKFYRTNGTGTLEAMRITSDGNVGIGTMSPSTKLHVNAGDTAWQALFGNTKRAGIWATTDRVIFGAYDSGAQLRLNLAGTDYVTLDTSGNLGVGTTSPDSTLDVRGSINQVVYLRPNGSTDGTQINTAISALPSNGGIIYLTPGTYHIDTKITIAKNGVKLRGYGACDPDLGAPDTPLTMLAWNTGSADGTVVELKPSSTNAQIQDIEITDLSIDGGTTDSASYGLVLDRVLNSKFLNVRVRNCTGTNGTGIKLTTTANGSGGDDVGTSWNQFEDCSVRDCTVGLSLGSETTGTPAAVANSCHNKFIDMTFESVTTTGVYLGDCDNNSFYGCMTGGGTYGVLAEGRLARSIYFYHLQPGGTTGLKVQNAPSGPWNNGSHILIWGYDRENGETPPAINSGATLTDYMYWIDSQGRQNSTLTP